MKHVFITKKKTLCTSISVAIFCMGGVGYVSAAESVFEKMIITAQKREQSIEAVGISVSAMSGDQMSDLGLDNTMEVTQQIPGLQLQSFSPAFTVFNLRGVSQNNVLDNMEAPVAAYFDEVYVGSMNAIGVQMYDMERVEVLRGPQGTLFGRNATGGLIHFLTRKADDDFNNGYFRAEYGDFNSLNFEGAAGGELKDGVRGRIAGRWESSDGYFKPGPLTEEGIATTNEYFTGLFGFPYDFTVPGGDGSTVGGVDSLSLRGNLEIDINDDTLVNLTASYSKDDDAPVGQYVVYLVGIDENGLGNSVDASNPLTGNVHRHAGNDLSAGGEDTGLDREITSLTGKISSKLSNGIEVTSITNWMEMDKSYRENPGGGAIDFPFLTEADYSQWSQELRFYGETDNVRWQVGGYYLNMELQSRSAIGGPLFFTEPGGFIDSFTDLNSTNWSIFGQIELDLSDTLTIIGGYRWSQDDKNLDFSIVATQSVQDPADFSPIPNGTVLFDLESEAVGEFSGLPTIDYGDYASRLQLNWQSSEETLTFLSYNRGIKGGNWATGAGVDLATMKHEAETLHSYELGIKTSLFEDKARINATVFYYDYKNYQAFSLVDFVVNIGNTDAKNKGGEIELFLSPTENWDIILGASFISSEIDEVQGPFGIVTDAELPQAPAYSINYLFRYNWDALNGHFALQLDGAFNDEQYLESHNADSSLQEAYGLVNASLSYKSAGLTDWQLSAWVKNLTDEEYAVYSNDVGGFVLRQYGAPTQFGVTYTYNW